MKFTWKYSNSFVPFPFIIPFNILSGATTAHSLCILLRELPSLSKKHPSSATHGKEPFTARTKEAVYKLHTANIAGRLPRCQAPKNERCHVTKCASRIKAPICWNGNLLVYQHRVQGGIRPRPVLPCKSLTVTWHTRPREGLTLRPTLPVLSLHVCIRVSTTFYLRSFPKNVYPPCCITSTNTHSFQYTHQSTPYHTPQMKINIYT